MFSLIADKVQRLAIRPGNGSALVVVRGQEPGQHGERIRAVLVGAGFGRDLRPFQSCGY